MVGDLEEEEGCGKGTRQAIEFDNGAAAVSAVATIMLRAIANIHVNWETTCDGVRKRSPKSQASRQALVIQSASTKKFAGQDTE